MNSRHWALTLAALICCGCAPASQTDVPKVVKHGDDPPRGRTDSPVSGSIAKSATSGDSHPTARAEQGLFGGDPVTSVSGELTSLAFDHDDVLWIGSKYSGVFAFKDGRFTLFDQYNTPVNDSSISEALVDSKNTKWFVAGRKAAIYTFDNTHWKEIPTGETEINTLRHDKRGRTWCIAGKRLSYIDNGTIREFTPQLSADDAKFWRDEVLGYDFDRRNILWVAMRSTSVFRIEGVTGKRVHSAAAEKSDPFGAPYVSFGGVASSPDNDEVYFWRLSPGLEVVRLMDGRADPVKTGPGGAYHPLRWFPGKKWALIDYLRNGVTLGDIGGKFERYGDGTPLANETVTDVAIQRPGLIWFATRFGGLSLLDNGEWTTFAPAQETRRRMAWQRQPIEELVKQEALEVDIHKALQNPRQYANKKIRFKGRIASSFEYAEMLDADGNPLGIWPNYENALAKFLSDTRQRNPPKAAVPNRGARQSEPTEYLGFLDWGGGFGHLAAWKNQFTIVEQYPADATPEEKAKFKQEYLKSCSASK